MILFGLLRIIQVTVQSQYPGCGKSLSSQQSKVRAFSDEWQLRKHGILWLASGHPCHCAQPVPGLLEVVVK